MGEVVVGFDPQVAEYDDVVKVTTGRISQSALGCLRDALRLEPLGRRLLVVREEAPKVTSGGLYKPDSAVEELATGWVISAGPMVGDETGANAKTGTYLGSPESLLLRKVTFGAYSGAAVVLKETDSKFGSDYVMLTDSDLHAIVRPEQKDNE